MVSARRRRSDQPHPTQPPAWTSTTRARAEAWDSGASTWSALGATASRLAVTARSNRSKSDQDPAEWLPRTVEVCCRYVGEWAGTKLRWTLSADEAEVAVLREVVVGRPDQAVTHEPAA